MSPALSGAVLLLSGERKGLKRRRLGLDRGKKVYYIIYKPIKVMRCFKMRRIYEDWKDWARG